MPTTARSAVATDASTEVDTWAEVMTACATAVMPMSTMNAPYTSRKTTGRRLARSNARAVVTLPTSEARM